MTRKTPVNVAASVRARLLTVSKERREDFTLTLMNYAAERFLYRLSQPTLRDQFILKGAMLFAVRIGEQYRPTRDLDLLGMGEATEASVNHAIREITATEVEDDGLVFDIGTLEVHAIGLATRSKQVVSSGGHPSPILFDVSLAALRESHQTRQAVLVSLKAHLRPSPRSTDLKPRIRRFPEPLVAAQRASPPRPQFRIGPDQDARPLRICHPSQRCAADRR